MNQADEAYDNFILIILGLNPAVCLCSENQSLSYQLMFPLASHLITQDQSYMFKCTYNNQRHSLWHSSDFITVLNSHFLGQLQSANVPKTTFIH